MRLLIEEGRKGSGETTLGRLMLVEEAELCWEEDEFYIFYVSESHEDEQSRK